MALRLHHLLLSLLPFAATVEAEQKRPDLDNELFEFGIDAGLLAIQDFNTEIGLGFNATFHGSEDFFIQFNYLAAEASYSAFENSQGAYFEGGDRDFIHYDLLLGYNLLAGELYVSEANSTLSNLYIVGGVGNISFGGEESFSATAGIGYKLGLSRRLNLRLDFRDHIYQSNLIAEDSTSHNMQFTLGVGYLL
ncbi:outer membrane beta-barrel domain-containing protein [Agaribacterium haliotis]|uniref:outer membrane beta-barrel domain-containing protein n=1 Tax=Agaribacterium haliotis TaxID=2013869 RepID=UPI000BB52F22|nr:outer membrane beta-barrel domain-containing protein [Agaribacterium haliotis]